MKLILFQSPKTVNTYPSHLLILKLLLKSQFMSPRNKGSRELNYHTRQALAKKRGAKPLEIRLDRPQHAGGINFLTRLDGGLNQTTPSLRPQERK